MSAFHFGVTRRKLSAREVKRRDRICKRHGGYGYEQYDESHGTAHGGRWIGWFSGPNQGAPWDQRLSMAVLSEVGASAGGAQ